MRAAVACPAKNAWVPEIHPDGGCSLHDPPQDKSRRSGSLSGRGFGDQHGIPRTLRQRRIAPLRVPRP